MDKPWKERINATRTRELEKRGEVLAKTPKEIKDRLSEIQDRGGVVFVSEEAKKEFQGDVDAVIV